MNKHTPGPWGFLNYKDDESLLSFGVSCKEEMLDRTRTGWYSLWCGIKPEDARLIAAAPELLEALVDMQQWVSAFAYSQGSIAHAEVLKSPRMVKASAAITKATGAL